MASLNYFMKGITDEDLYKRLSTTLQRHKITWNKFISVATGGSET